MIKSTDKNYLEEIKGFYETFDEKCKTNIGEDYSKRIHPFDKTVREKLDKIKLSTENEFELFHYTKEIKELWSVLIEKSIICLRYYDDREPFKPKDGHSTNKEPYAYGVTELKNFFDRYVEYETVLYGSSSYYRDHVIHVFRVWLLGLRQLLYNDCDYLERIKIEKGYEVNYLEKLSVWTIIALTHDLGYPLQKSQEIVDKTRMMMKSFVENPLVMMDLSFRGVQNSMNDYVLRFISSKMREIDTNTGLLKDLRNAETKEASKTIGKDSRFVARLQPKYYFKFQKSLEHNQHGILSSLIIYKLLLYFLESDYSINEDYIFEPEDTRQFYLRREILRSIASHTCKDIYQLDLNNFSFLLRLCDDAQEWGRKNISELYVDKTVDYDFDGIKIGFSNADNSKVSIKESYEMSEKLAVKCVLDRFFEQSTTYRDVFRDGQESLRRNFDFEKCDVIKINKGANKETYKIKLQITAKERTKIVLSNDDAELKVDDEFFKTTKESFEELFKNNEFDDHIISRGEKSISFTLP